MEGQLEKETQRVGRGGGRGHAYAPAWAVEGARKSEDKRTRPARAIYTAAAVRNTSRAEEKSRGKRSFDQSLQCLAELVERRRAVQDRPA